MNFELDKKVKVKLKNGKILFGYFDDVLGRYDWGTEKNHYILNTGVEEAEHLYEIDPDEVEELEYF